MKRERFEAVIADIENAANTCNHAAAMLEGALFSSKEEMIKTTALIGINQALIALVEEMLDEEEGNG